MKRSNTMLSEINLDMNADHQNSIHDIQVNALSADCIKVMVEVEKV